MKISVENSVGTDLNLFIWTAAYPDERSVRMNLLPDSYRGQPFFVPDLPGPVPGLTEYETCLASASRQAQKELRQ